MSFFQITPSIDNKYTLQAKHKNQSEPKQPPNYLMAVESEQEQTYSEELTLGRRAWVSQFLKGLLVWEQTTSLGC